MSIFRTALARLQGANWRPCAGARSAMITRMSRAIEHDDLQRALALRAYQKATLTRSTSPMKGRIRGPLTLVSVFPAKELGSLIVRTWRITCWLMIVSPDMR